MSFADAYGGSPGGSAGPSGGQAAPSTTFYDTDSLAKEAKKFSGLIFQMTTNVGSFKRMVDSLGTGKDTRELRQKLNTQRETIGGMAKEAARAVKQLAANGADDQKSQKVVRDFHSVLKEFQRAQRQCAEREQTFLPQTKKGSGGYGANEYDGEREAFGHSDSEQQSLLQKTVPRPRGRQDLVRDEGEMEFNNALIEEREMGILEIQQQIGEVNEIFQDLAVLVNEQGTMIDDIEANIVSTAVRTKDAQRELTKADKSQKAARNKMICLAIVVAAVLTVLILFLLN